MLPLADRRILVTRARGQASSLAVQLQAFGATAILIPTIEIAPPASYCGLDAALVSIRSFDWLLFTSANAVQAYMQRARSLRLPPQAKRIGAIGQATARAVTESGLAEAVDLVPPLAIAESFAESLAPHAKGTAILLVRAAVARDVLPDALTGAGARVTIAEAYRNIIPAESVTLLGLLFATDPPDAITFTSASAAENLVSLLAIASLEIPKGTVLASIGPITSQAMRTLGLHPTLEPFESTIPALAAALAEHFNR